VSNLISLLLGEDKLKVLLNNISKLKKLVLLGVGKNLLRNLPMHLSELTNLQFLFAYDNRLIYLPSSLWQLQKLCRMDLHKNEFLAFHDFPNMKKQKFISTKMQFQLCKN